MKHLILIGIMGTGKSTVGQLLHNKTGQSWIDIDQQLEMKWGMTISAFFERYGENAFREEESLVLKGVLNSITPTIISTGGGSVIKKENRQIMLWYGKVICLTATVRDVIQRVQNDNYRPLIAGNVEDRVRKLIQKRRGLYDFAHLKINTSNATYPQIVDDIISFWNIDQDVLESSNSILI